MKNTFKSLAQRTLSLSLVLSLLTPVALFPETLPLAHATESEDLLRGTLSKLDSTWVTPFERVTHAISDLKAAGTAYTASNTRRDSTRLTQALTQAENALISTKELIEREVSSSPLRTASEAQLFLLLVHNYYELLVPALEAFELLHQGEAHEATLTGRPFDGNRVDARFRIVLSSQKGAALLDRAEESFISDLRLTPVEGNPAQSTLEIESRALYSLVQDRLIGTPSASMIQNNLRSASGQLIATELAGLNSFLYSENQVSVNAESFPGRDGAFLASIVNDNAEANLETNFRSVYFSNLFEAARRAFPHRSEGFSPKLVAFFTTLARNYSWALDPRKLYANSLAFAGFVGGQMGLQYLSSRQDRASRAERDEAVYFKQVFSHYPEHFSKSNAESLKQKLTRVVIEAETQALMGFFSCALFKDSAEGRGRMEDGRPIRSECERTIEENAILVQSELFAKSNGWDESKKGLLREDIRAFVARNIQADQIPLRPLEQLLEQKPRAVQLLISEARYKRASKMLEAARLVENLSNLKKQMMSPDVNLRPGTENTVPAGLLPLKVEAGLLMDSYDEFHLNTDQALHQIDDEHSYVLSAPWMSQATRTILGELESAEATESQSANDDSEETKLSARELRANLVGILQDRVRGAKDHASQIVGLIVQGNPSLRSKLRNAPNHLLNRSIPVVSATARFLSAIARTIGELGLWKNDSVFAALEDSSLSAESNASVRWHRELFNWMASAEPIIHAEHQNIQQIVRVNDHMHSDSFYRNAGAMERARKILAADSERSISIGSVPRSLLRNILEFNDYLESEKLQALQAELDSATDRLFVGDVFPLFRIQLQTEFFLSDYLNSERLDILHTVQRHRGMERSNALKPWLARNQTVFNLYIDRHIRLLKERYPGLDFKISLPTEELQNLAQNESDIYFWEYLVGIDKLLQSQPDLVDQLLSHVAGLRENQSVSLSSSVATYPLQNLVEANRLAFADRRVWLERATYGALAYIAASSTEQHRAYNHPSLWPNRVKRRDLYGAYGDFSSLNQRNAWRLKLPIACTQKPNELAQRQCFRTHIAGSLLSGVLLQVPLRSAAVRAKRTLQKIASNHGDWEELVFYSEAFTRLRSLFLDSLGGGLSRMEKEATATSRHLESIKTAWGEANHGIFSMFLWNMAIPFGPVIEGIMHAVMWPGMAIDVAFNIWHFNNAIQIYNSMRPYAYSSFLTSGLLSTASMRETQDRIRQDAETLWNRLWMDALWTTGMIRGRFEQPRQERQYAAFNRHFQENGLDRFTTAYRELLQRGASQRERTNLIRQVAQTASRTFNQGRSRLPEVFRRRRTSDATEARETEENLEGQREATSSDFMGRVNPQLAQAVLQQTALTIELQYSYELFTEELQTQWIPHKTPTEALQFITQSFEAIRRSFGNKMADEFKWIKEDEEWRPLSIETVAEEMLSISLSAEILARELTGEVPLQGWEEHPLFEGAYTERHNVSQIDSHPLLYLNSALRIFGTTPEAIRRKHREMSRHMHPDTSTESNASERFQVFEALYRLALEHVLNPVAHTAQDIEAIRSIFGIEITSLNMPLLNAENPRENNE